MSGSWTQLLPFLIFGLALAYFLLRLGQYWLWQRLGKGVPEDAEMLRRGETVFLGRSLRQVFAWTMDPVVRVLSSQRVHPNTLTLLCLLISILAGGLIAGGTLALGGVVGLIGSVFDYFDGRVARSRGSASKAGAFLDSTLDRYCDIAFLTGAGILFRESPWVLGATMVGMGSAIVISYTRAKAESLNVELKVGLMQRPERVVLFCLGAIASPMADPFLPVELQGGHLVFALALLLLALLSTQTAVHRTWAGFRSLAALDRENPS